ncbi:MAG: kelch repeat-containing protein, partial [Bacteroidota bacterium]
MNKFLVLIMFIAINSCTLSRAKKVTTSTNQEGEKIGVRNAHMMAYNSEESKVYLYGGANHEKVLSDLWTLEDQTWKKIGAKLDPPARTFGCLSYEEKENRMILF